MVVRRAPDYPLTRPTESEACMPDQEYYDVLIIGAGLAGLALARQLLLNTDKKILLVDRRAEFPPLKQKVGEATVQLSAYYYARVLDLEEHLMQSHYLKYNLRFYWKTPGLANDCYEHYSQSYIRKLSNINTYQLDRNKFEGEMLRVNLERPNFAFRPGATDLDVTLAEDGGPHTFSFQASGRDMSGQARWVVDTSGRGKFLAKRLGLTREGKIRHGSHFFWVEGLLDIEKLTSLSSREIRLRPDRAALGHTPAWQATNHFCAEGLWFWTIPLHGKTSLGLVYDSRVVPRGRVDTLEKLIAWVCEEFPLFARDLPYRRVLHHTALKDFAHDCQQTISPARWAIAGEAGRFTDPLYSPGGDLISLYNTFITDAIQTEDDSELAEKCRLYEQMMEAVYDAYVPTYAISYDALGDQEAFSLKYAWELAIYFAYYVFPFINDLFTDRRFLSAFIVRFSQLGRINKSLQSFISAFFQWKKRNRTPPREVFHFDFTDIKPLADAEKTFYKVGLSADEARVVLDEQLANLREMARFMAAQICASVLGDMRALTNRRFVEGLDINRLRFDPEEIRAGFAACEGSTEEYPWTLDPHVPRRLIEGQGDPVTEDESEVLAGVGGD
jgi:2-polyprenyl-6-methoxyphenol hydroxylase-like FAD-dependent oxidoreductase